MNASLLRWVRIIIVAGVLPGAAALPAYAQQAPLALPPQTQAILDDIYSLKLNEAIEGAKRLERDEPEHPLGYLLEAEALWWRIWCTSAEFKYGMTSAHRRPKLATDRRYFELAAKVTSLANAQLEQHDSAEMEFYSGMGSALAARLYGLRYESRNTAHHGVLGREHLLRALQLDPRLTDAALGLGLYNYYVDTLGPIARMLRFFMGVPGGSKEDGLRQLREVASSGQLTRQLAEFYLSSNQMYYDQKYEAALAAVKPLTEKYPANPIFRLVEGDCYAKLARREQAIECYRAAAMLPVEDAECARHLQALARASLEAQGVISPEPDQAGAAH